MVEKKNWVFCEPPLPAWSAPGARAAWVAGHARLRSLGLTVDQPPTGVSWDGERAQIPRLDLPFGMPRWQGTSGDRVVRSKRVTGADPPPEPAYKVWAPRWVDALVVGRRLTDPSLDP